MTITLPLPGGVHTNAIQTQTIAYYNLVDPGGELLGYHNDRPVIWTFVNVYRDTRDARRHVVIVQRNGEPGDLPISWEERFHFLPEVTGDGPTARSKRQRVREIINDWFSWSVRS